MARRIAPDNKSKDPSLKTSLDCIQELDELERFHLADQAPIPVSQVFKTRLREKIWQALKKTCLMVLTLSVLPFL